MDKQMAKSVVLVDPEEYESLTESRDLLAQIIRLASARTPDPRALNARETIAISFMSEFDPSRADDWGHISYCFTRALNMAIVVAGQEARR